MKHDSDRTLVISLGRNGRASYPERPWEDIEPVLRRMWEFDGRLRAWHDVRAEVQAAWRASDDLVSPRARRAFERSRAA
ncbi:hypothetical protein LU699_03165 [Luteimonas fraxinea]|uniref:Uncharacterized protein n=1 Tax=Luteimonas fraxinea TaxID=2901869 RepID=A0ABS8UAR6_9GAMM|nr:hypothetical protein [Luteimonas fraxinea]MCD9096082.1 hypothetical protein [Luteimonas fraxinea]UHH10747.1 hypothetical protein LU699_03165 [Luteimonas fraxinea]